MIYIYIFVVLDIIQQESSYIKMCVSNSDSVLSAIAFIFRFYVRVNGSRVRRASIYRLYRMQNALGGVCSTLFSWCPTHTYARVRVFCPSVTTTPLSLFVKNAKCFDNAERAQRTRGRRRRRSAVVSLSLSFSLSFLSFTPRSFSIMKIHFASSSSSSSRHSTTAVRG